MARVRLTKAAKAAGLRPARGHPDVPRAEPAAAGSWSVVTHEALFDPASEERCDACGVRLSGAAGSGRHPGGRGAYVHARGGHVQIETVPLCPSCASAIGLTALARWEIEEEEG